MDIATQAEVLLRQERFQTWSIASGHVPAVGFEDETVVGFIHVFPSACVLLDGWEAAQRAMLGRHAAALRSAGAKAWHVYSVFLTDDPGDALAGRVERIEEDFSLTRKIARCSVRSAADLRRALLPLLSLRVGSAIGEAGFEDRLRARLSDIPEPAVTAFLRGADAEDVVRILVDAP
jgi:hypothetical protein